ncbi:MAG: hypothetical protein WA711_15655, partial [Pseudolabrys sp.]
SMSALGQKQTCAVQTVMSALPPKATLNAFSQRLPPKADMCGAAWDVRLGLIADLSQFLGFQIIKTLLAIDSVGSEKTEMMSHPLNEEQCPVAESVLGQLYRSSPQGLAPLIEAVPAFTRAVLAVYCGRRAHLASIGLAIASICEKDSLIDAGGDFGAKLFEQARRTVDPQKRPKISLSNGSLMRVICEDLT